RSVARDAGERLIGRRDQAACEGDALRLVAVEQRWIRASVQNRGELPGEIHGVADAGIHALTTHWTVNVGGVAEQERATLAEPIGDPMVHVVGREPVHALD